MKVQQFVLIANWSAGVGVSVGKEGICKPDICTRFIISKNPFFRTQIGSRGRSKCGRRGNSKGGIRGRSKDGGRGRSKGGGRGRSKAGSRGRSQGGSRGR